MLLKNSRFALSVLISGFLAMACASGEKSSDQAPEATPHPQTAEVVQPSKAILQPAKGSKVAGTVQFIPQDNGVRIVTDISGLQPNAQHGFHIHEFGDCSDPSFQTAGGHYNPEGKEHGEPGAQSHVGDLGNLSSDAKGRVKTEMVIENLNGYSNKILGRSVVIHKSADDLKSQPAGNSGDRIACGVIGILKQ